MRAIILALVLAAHKTDHIGPAGVPWYVRLDAKVRAGEWTPKARWMFKNGVEVTTGVAATAPDEDGERSLAPLWLFTTPEAKKAMKKEAKDF